MVCVVDSGPSGGRKLGLIALEIGSARAVKPDSKDCISLSICGKMRVESGLREGESNETPTPNGCMITAGVADFPFSSVSCWRLREEEAELLYGEEGAVDHCMTSEKTSPRGGC